MGAPRIVVRAASVPVVGANVYDAGGTDPLGSVHMTLHEVVVSVANSTMGFTGEGGRRVLVTVLEAGDAPPAFTAFMNTLYVWPGFKPVIVTGAAVVPATTPVRLPVTTVPVAGVAV